MPPSPPASTNRRAVALRRVMARACFAALLVVSAMLTPAARADTLARGIAAFDRGNYIVAFRELRPVAEAGNARAAGLVGFMYEHGFGTPLAYEPAVDFYTRGAMQGDPFSQAMLGLMCDKGHGIRQDFVLAYKWLDLAAARTRGREHDAYARFRDAVASKMSGNEIVIGQRLAVAWVPVAIEPAWFPRK
jgi:uncharacterized protein